MNKNNLSFIFGSSFLLLFSCDSIYYIQGKKTIPKEIKKQTSEIEDLHKTEKLTDKIIKTALKYRGTKYRPGGTDNFGMDCSGLVHTTFRENNILLPRNSFDQSKIGTQVTFENLSKGDLIFFKTMGLKRISHVGIVTERTMDNIQFIHSSSEGVIISSTQEKYWNRAYVSGSRIINEEPRVKYIDKNTLLTGISIENDTLVNNENQTVREISYVVKKGDNLYNIANLYNKTISEIKTTNQLNSDKLNVGMVLKIATKTIEDIPLCYMVKKGDSLSLIAKNQNTTVKSIKEINNLTSDIITIGMTLLIL